MTDDISTRLARALETESPGDSVLQLARLLAEEGVAKAQLERFFSDALEIAKQQGNETHWDALADALDYIVGWCAPNDAIFPSSETSGG